MNQFLRFLLVGGFNTLFGYCVIFSAMYLIGLGPELSNAAGYLFGLIVSYILNKNFTFRSKRTDRTEMLRFGLVFVIAYGANFVMLLLLIRQFSIHPGVSQVLAGLVYILMSYLLNKYYVFKSRNNDGGRHDGAPIQR